MNSYTEVNEELGEVTTDRLGRKDLDKISADFKRCNHFCRR